MVKKGLTYLLLLSIALQSLFAVADNRQIHQIDTEHLKVEHSHQSDKQIKTAPDSKLTSMLDSNIEHDNEDCHHCGHCHGSHAQWLALNHLSMPIHSARNNLFNYQSKLNIGTQENLFRPPIS